MRGYFFYEGGQGGCSFYARCELEARVEVDAYHLGMMKGCESLSVFRTDASTEEEGKIAVVAIEHRPVKLLATASYCLAFCVKQEEVNNIGITVSFLYVVSLRYADSLHHLSVLRQHLAQFHNVGNRLAAVKLNDVETASVGNACYLLIRLIYKHSHTGDILGNGIGSREVGDIA